MKISEHVIQSILMKWLMEEKHHEFVIPNSTSLFGTWESDLVSVTKSGLLHEFEIKISRSDFKKDADKYKHHHIGKDSYSPAYFWYVTFGFEIEVPEKAGWIEIVSKRDKYKILIRKEAPRLNTWKPNKETQIARLLSWRLTNLYAKESGIDYSIFQTWDKETR